MKGAYRNAHRLAVAGLLVYASSITAGNQVVDTDPVDTARGEALYENHCRECHDKRAFTREKRRAQNLQQLQGWVAAWSVHTGLGWDAETVRDVTAFINQRFYGYRD